MPSSRRSRCASGVGAASPPWAWPAGRRVVGAAGVGGIAWHVARELEARTGKESRAVVLGHLQRGGGPTTYDRLLALRFGAAAVRHLVEGASSGMVGVAGDRIVLASLDEAAA